MESVKLIQEQKNDISSIGSLADMKAGVDISRVHGGYFSNPENAKAFFDVGIEKIETELPKEIKYADYGGGQGFLAINVQRFLEKDGHGVETIVVDANDAYLEKAKELGLETKKCNLENCDIADLDLITMRAVNHYNSLEKQQEIVKNVYECLKDGGYVVSQVSSGSEGNCRLRASIVNLPALGRHREGEEGYYWTTEEEYKELLLVAGFKDINTVGYAPSNAWGPEEQWNRFNAKRTQGAVQKNDQAALEQIKLQKQEFLMQAKTLLDEYRRKYEKQINEDENYLSVEEKEDGSYVIHYTYPVISARK